MSFDSSNIVERKTVAEIENAIPYSLLNNKSMSQFPPPVQMENASHGLGKALNVNNVFKSVSIGKLKPAVGVPPISHESNNDSLVLVLQGASQEIVRELLQYLAVKDWVRLPPEPGQDLKINGVQNNSRNGNPRTYLFSQQKQLAESDDLFLDTKDEFLKLVNGVIERHLDDENFRASCLSKVICLCGMQLHRKLKKRANLSPANYIRKYRLLRSRSFLQETHLSISEVCYKVGFRSLEYFSRSFKKEFGESPSQYRGRC